MVACSLAGGQYDERVTRWHQLLGDAPRERTVTGGVTVQLPADRAAALADLVVVEQECCPFFTFHLAFVGATVELTADAPAQAQPLIDALLGRDAPSSRGPALSGPDAAAESSLDDRAATTAV